MTRESMSTATVSKAEDTAGSAATPGDARQRILITSVADHLDRSERVLTDIMNAPVTRGGGGDISTAQRWADDLLTTSRLYRQDAVDAGEQSVATVLDDIDLIAAELVALSPVDWTRVGRHETLGVMDLWQFLDRFVTGHYHEHADQLDQLRALGCDQAQGYLFGRAAPAPAISELLTARP